MKFTVLALSMGLLGQAIAGVIPSQEEEKEVAEFTPGKGLPTLAELNLTVRDLDEQYAAWAKSRETSPNDNNPLTKRAPSWYCAAPENRRSTSAGIERCIAYLRGRGKERIEFSGQYKVCDEANRDRPGGYSRVYARSMKNGQEVSHKVGSYAVHYAMGLQHVLDNCKNNNCPKLTYCGVEGNAPVHGNGDIWLITDGGGNW